MAYSPQDVYAKHLVSRRGYPLWTPEPNMNLPDTYIREGLKIGDVGVVVPEDGSFDVFFNVCLPHTHALHRETGVPDNFAPIILGGRDIAKFPKAECVGRIISTSSVTRVRGTAASDDDPGPERRTQLGPLNYEFTLSAREGAVLILPEGAERYYLRNERLFMDKAIQEAVDWYNFAEQRLGRVISHDSLYLITGFYKARSWSLAAYQRGAGGEASAQFKAAQVGRGNIAASYTWETTHAMDWRVGPEDPYYNGIANQTVFIEGFKIAVREGILGKKRVNVKAGFPSVRTYRAELSNGSWFPNLWGRGSRSSSTVNAQAPRGTGSVFNMDNSGDVTVQRFPQVSKPFHPSDVINQYLLREVPSATIAVTHDSQWTTLLKRGLLDPGELAQEDRLLAGVVSRYDVARTHDGAVYLDSEGTMIESDDDNMVTTSMVSSILSDTPTPQSSDSDLMDLDGPSAMPYACGYGSVLLSHVMYPTAHELQEHVKLAHPDIVGTFLPIFRCGLPGCRQSWKRLEELEYHIQLSHSQNAISVDSVGHSAEPSESAQVVSSIAPAIYAGSGTSAFDDSSAAKSRDILSRLDPSPPDRSLFENTMSDRDPGLLPIERSGGLGIEGTSQTGTQPIWKDVLALPPPTEHSGRYGLNYLSTTTCPPPSFVSPRATSESHFPLMDLEPAVSPSLSDTRAPWRLSSDLQATPDPSIKPYACGHENCWPSNATSSRACYCTSRGLSDHSKSAHPEDSGGDRPYRCGLEGCGKSWKSINGLQYHLQISKAHFQHAITSSFVSSYISGLAVPASVEASTSNQGEDKTKKQYKCPHENCPNRYKQLSGLRYHLAHGHPVDLPKQLDLVPRAVSRRLAEKTRTSEYQTRITAQPKTMPSPRRSSDADHVGRTI